MCIPDPGLNDGQVGTMSIVELTNRHITNENRHIVLGHSTECEGLCIENILRLPCIKDLCKAIRSLSVSSRCCDIPLLIFERQEVADFNDWILYVQ